MRTQIQVLSNDECAELHERSLKLLYETGVRVVSDRARQFLRRAGAQVDEAADRVRFPRPLIEESLRLAPRKFTWRDLIFLAGVAFVIFITFWGDQIIRVIA